MMRLNKLERLSLANLSYHSLPEFQVPTPLGQAPGLTRKYKTRLELLAWDKCDIFEEKFYVLFMMFSYFALLL
jgi:hypothetical protein